MIPKVSVIVSVWNDEQHVSSCIDSIKRQSFEDFECIIVDDGSMDATVEVSLQSIDGDTRFHILNISHSGLSNARNVGVEHSSSDIIFHIDADDEVVPEMLEHSIHFLEKNDLEMLFFDAMVHFDEHSSFMQDGMKKYFARKKCYGISTGRKMLEEMTFNGDYAYAVFLQIVRKSAIRKKFLCDLRAQDILYTTQNLFLAEKVGHLSELLYVKNTFLNSVSNSRYDAHYAWSLLKMITELQNFAENQKHTISLERVVAYLFQCLTYAIRHLEKKDWMEIEKMSFTEKSTLANLARLVYTPDIRRKLNDEMSFDLSLISF